ncbi:glycosyltransferase [Arhodomonas sp. SL1]|uniref:glycosyltransferase n=1 Tax=Arhodomonas sp. SL1 TaxID=3425691 RepID=UPI003F88400C
MLLVITGFWPTRVNRVTGIFVVQQVRALAAAGFRVVVLVPRTVGRGESARLTLEQLGLDTRRVELREFPLIRAPEMFSRIPGVVAGNVWLVGVAVRRAVRRYGLGPGVRGTIVHGLRYLGLSVGSWRTRSLGPVVAVMHGIDPGLRDHEGASGRLLKRTVRGAAEALDRVALVGSPLRAHARQIGVPEEKLTVVLNGTEVPNALGEDSRSHYPKPGRVRVVSVSNLIKLKGIDYNIEALGRIAKRMPDLAWEYHIVGDGPERQRLQALALEHGIEDRVTFRGRLDYETTMAELGKGDIFALPSWQEAFGITYLEAMARGVPVIGCHGNGPADFVTPEYDGLLIRAHDVDALSAALQRLITESGLRDRLGRSARETARKHTWDENAKVMLGLLGLSDTDERTEGVGGSSASAVGAST